MLHATAPLNACRLAALGVAALAAPGSQADPRPNDPALCPYFGPELELLGDAGFISLGGFEFGMTDTGDIDAMLSRWDIRWIETEHFELGFALEDYKPSAKERKGFEAELDVLRVVLPDLPKKTSKIDRWTRTILYAKRAEAVYARVQELLQVDDSMFPEPGTQWTSPETYWGWGKYMGQRGKFELLILPGENASKQFLKQQFGLIVPRTQRWNVIERDALLVVYNDASDGLNRDPNMHAHMSYNLAIQLLDGYKHYSFDIPVWLSVGFGHVIERELNPYYNTFDMSEGGDEIDARESDWYGHVKDLVTKGEAPSLAELMRLDDYGDMDFDDHATAWSYVQFLTRQHPDEFAGLVGRLKSMLDEDLTPTGAGLSDVLREDLRGRLGWSYAQFQTAWSEWLGDELTAELNKLPRK